MWVNGPLRVWSLTSEPGCRMPRSSGGFTGPYVCDTCDGRVVGVYSQNRGATGPSEWLCAGCKKPRKAKKTPTQDNLSIFERSRRPASDICLCCSEER
jgi:hypothetical protein